VPYTLINLSNKNHLNKVCFEGDLSPTCRSLSKIKCPRSKKKEVLKRLLSHIASDADIDNPNGSNKLIKKIYSTSVIEYLSSYFCYSNPKHGFDVKTIIIEKKYVSRSYLQDYSNYYSLGYTDYGKDCTRLHFFENLITESDFQKFISRSLDDKKDRALKHSYYGNIVIKPLPNSIIGPSIVYSYTDFHLNKLQHQSSSNAKTKIEKLNRVYKGKRTYKLNLFGRRFKIKTLIYQQQDQAVSACATAALWMTFHKISQTFKTSTPSPSSITSSAGLAPKSGRIFPNTGLDITQVIKAIDSLAKPIVSEVLSHYLSQQEMVKNQPTLISAIPTWKVKRYIYAYLQLDIPILLGYLVNKENLNHLVAVTGYRKERESEKDDVENNFIIDDNITQLRTEADRIYALYAHDDQLGPYAKIGFNNRYKKDSLKVGWLSNTNYELGTPIHIIIPLIDLIKISYNDVESFVEKLQLLLDTLDKKTYSSKNVLWDIRILKSNKYKRELSKLDSPSSNSKTTKFLLTQSLPKYIWVVRMNLITDKSDLENSTLLVDFVIDATESPSTIKLDRLNFFDQDFFKFWLNLSEEKDFVDLVDSIVTNKYSSFGRQVKEILENINR